MHRVKAVVECEKVGDRADKVARHVVVAQTNLAAVVLEQVHGDDAPLRAKVGQPHERERAAPVQGEQEHARGDEQRPLRRRSSLLLARRGAQIRHVEAEYRRRDRRLEKEQVEQVPPVAHRRGAHGVLSRLGVLVVAEVVPGDKRACRVPVGEGEQRAPCGFESRATKARLVHCVVRDACACEAEVCQDRCARECFEAPRRGCRNEIRAGKGDALGIFAVV